MNYPLSNIRYQPINMIFMTTKIYQDYELLSQATANFILDYLQKKPKSLVCIGSGDTPKRVCQLLVAAQKNQFDFSQVTFVGLDEWVGMDENDAGSCKNFVFENLYRPLSILPKKIKYFDAKATDLQAECDKINALIAQNGGLDIMLVGVGMNGHIALNEPHTPFTSLAHVSELAEVTIEVGQKYFTQKTPLTQGITLGLQHFSEAKLPILIANGLKKSAIIYDALTNEVTEDLPASIVQIVEQCLVLLDRDAGDALLR
jgi:glucosamine-6-phosphate deaminase